VVRAGTVIPGALITGIRSDLPGKITAQVTENVRDTPPDVFVLIPQKARLIGIFDSQMSTPCVSKSFRIGFQRLSPISPLRILDRRCVERAGGFRSFAVTAAADTPPMPL
jgi:hypothetical protein